MKKLLVLFLVMLCFSVAVSAFVPECETEILQITSDTSNQEYPDVYGDKIVWQDSRNGNYDIYMYDLSTEQETPIVSNTANQVFPAIYDNKIIWGDNRNNEWGIYMYDLSTGQETQIASNTVNFAMFGSGEKFGPAIYDNKVIWSDYYDIYMYDLSTGQKTKIAPNTALQHWSAIYDNKIAWHDNRDGYWNVYMYDLSTEQETQITSHTTIQDHPAIYDDKIIWQDQRNGNYDIYLYDLSTQQETLLTDIADQYYPDIYANKVVWHDVRDGNRNVYVYDLSTGQEIQLTTNTAEKEYPAIYDDKIVWTDNRNENDDIYMATICPIGPECEDHGDCDDGEICIDWFCESMGGQSYVVVDDDWDDLGYYQPVLVDEVTYYYDWNAFSSIEDALDAVEDEYDDCEDDCEDECWEEYGDCEDECEEYGQCEDGCEEACEDVDRTVYVFEGTYEECVEVEIVGLNLVGQSREGTIIDGDCEGPIVYMGDDDVSIDSFTIINRYDNLMPAIFVGNYYGEGVEEVYSPRISNIIIDSADNYFGIAMIAAEGSITDSIIRNTCSGIFLYESIGILVGGNVIDSNGIREECEMPTTGIDVLSSEDVLIEDNEITNNDVGVHVDPEGWWLEELLEYLFGGEWEGECSTEVAIVNNKITGNDEYGVVAEGCEDDDEYDVDVRLNWWGYATGPSSEDNPNGEGDAVIGERILYSPWYTSEDMKEFSEDYECYSDGDCNEGRICIEGSCQDDFDYDSVPDDEDNCPEDYNPDQEDSDGDGLGDVCDTPECGNGFVEGEEECDDGNLEEGDGCNSECNIEEQDSDDDGIPDDEDNCPDDPDNDADDDAICGDVDNCPYIENPEQEDLDEDGTGDACDADKDGDGKVTVCTEGCDFTDIGSVAMWLFSTEEDEEGNVLSATASQDITISVASGDGESSVALPQGTVITMVDGGSLDVTALTASDVDEGTLLGLGTGTVVSGALQWGIANLGLQFSIPITLKIYVGTGLSGQVLDIVRSTTGDSGWTSDGISPATCTVTADGYCEFKATKASYYATTQTPVTSSGTTSSSGTGGSSSKKWSSIQVEETSQTSCKENWVCDDWSECDSSGKQTRDCNDINDCGTIADKQVVIQDCVYFEEGSAEVGTGVEGGAAEEGADMGGVTGMFTGMASIVDFSKGNKTLTAMLVLICLSVIGYLTKDFWFKKK